VVAAQALLEPCGNWPAEVRLAVDATTSSHQPNPSTSWGVALAVTMSLPPRNYSEHLHVQDHRCQQLLARWEGGRPQDIIVALANSIDPGTRKEDRDGSVSIPAGHPPN
jgi:hypothetical protein